MAPSRHHSNHHNHGGHQGHSTAPVQGGGGGGNASGASNATGLSSSASGAHGGTDASQDSAAGLPPAPTRLDTSQAQTYRLQDAYWSDEDEDMECPLCLEEIDISDANFKPCPCGYQICRFCWHHIKQNLNGRCPACRRKYSDTTVEFKPMSQDEIKRLAQAKKQKEREKRELEQMNRKHLANMRVVQKNLVYVVGMDAKLAREELIPTLRSNEYFGQYGRISKILISKRTTASKLIMGTQESSIGVYVTYVRKEDAARAIVAIDGSKGSDGRTVRASYGTTKYCTTYLRNLPCTNPICTYLHEPGEEADSFTKEDLTTLRHAAKDAENRIRPTPAPSSFHAATRPHEHTVSGSTASGVGFSATSAPASTTSASAAAAAAAATAAVTGGSTLAAVDGPEGSALPKTASWASGKPMVAPALANNTIRDVDLPPLSAIANTPNSRKASAQRIPVSPITTPARTALSSKRSQAHHVRAESPVPPRSATASPAPLAATPPMPAAPPGLTNLSGEATSKASSSNGSTGGGGSLQREPAASSRIKDDALESDSIAPPPPGLSKHGIAPPPGLASRSGTPSAETASTASEPKTSHYQLSSNAQAVLDDMRARRETEDMQPVKSPFPDFDATLSSFRDGDDFCFTLEESLIPAHLRNANSNQGQHNSGANLFTPFSTASTFAGIGAHLSSATPPPPPGLSGAMTEAAGAPQTYSGRFDPFAPGAGETLLSQSKEDSAPFAAIDEMRRTLSEKRGPTAEQREDEENSASRFGFAKRTDSFKTTDDLLGFVKGGALLHSSNFGYNDSTQSTQNGTSTTMNGFGPPSGGDWLLGGAGGGYGSTAHQQPSRDSPLSSLLPTQGNNYTTDRSYFAAGVGNGGSLNPGTPGTGGGADSVLLAQLMNRKPNDGSASYQDPAIMSYARQQQQQQQLYAAGQQQQHQSSSFGYSFNPFDGQMPGAGMYGGNGGGGGPHTGYQQLQQQPHQHQQPPSLQQQQQQLHHSQQSQAFGGHRTFA